MSPESVRGSGQRHAEARVCGLPRGYLFKRNAIRAVPANRGATVPHSRQSGHALGIVLVAASTAFFALAGVFTKSTSADPWTIACWRGLIASLAIGAYVLVRRGGTGQSLRLGRRGWALAIAAAASSALFIASFKYTY